MSSKSQLAVFVIIGLVVVMAVFLAVYSVNKSKIETIEYSGEIKVMKEGVSETIKTCIEDVSSEGIVISGFKKPKEVEDFIKTELEKCYDISFYEEQGAEFTIGEVSPVVEITRDAVVVSVDYPISIEHNGETAHMQTFTYTMPRNEIIDIEYDSDGTVKDYYINLAEGTYTLVIEKGTKIKAPNGDGPDRIMMRLLDQTDFGQLNPAVFNKVILEGFPIGITFEPEAELVMQLKNIPVGWDDKDVQENIAIYLKDARIGIWEKLPTKFSPPDILSSPISHFSQASQIDENKCYITPLEVDLTDSIKYNSPWYDNSWTNNKLKENSKLSIQFEHKVYEKNFFGGVGSASNLVGIPPIGRMENWIFDRGGLHYKIEDDYFSPDTNILELYTGTFTRHDLDFVYDGFDYAYYLLIPDSTEHSFPEGYFKAKTYKDEFLFYKFDETGKEGEFGNDAVIWGERSFTLEIAGLGQSCVDPPEGEITLSYDCFGRCDLYMNGRLMNEFVKSSKNGWWMKHTLKLPLSEILKTMINTVGGITFTLQGKFHKYDAFVSGDIALNSITISGANIFSKCNTGPSQNKDLNPQRGYSQKACICEAENGDRTFMLASELDPSICCLDGSIKSNWEDCFEPHKINCEIAPPECCGKYIGDHVCADKEEEHRMVTYHGKCVRSTSEQGAKVIIEPTETCTGTTSCMEIDGGAGCVPDGYKDKCGDRTGSYCVDAVEYEWWEYILYFGPFILNHDPQQALLSCGENPGWVVCEHGCIETHNIEEKGVAIEGGSTAECEDPDKIYCNAEKDCPLAHSCLNGVCWDYREKG